MKKLKIQQNEISLSFKDLKEKVITSSEVNYRTNGKEDDVFSATKKNNTDIAFLENSINEDGYDNTEKTIVLMPLEVYMKGHVAKQRLQDFANSKQLKAINYLENMYSHVSSPKTLQDYKKTFDSYYVLLGGFTRYSIIMSNCDDIDGRVKAKLITFKDFEKRNKGFNIHENSDIYHMNNIRMAFTIFTELIIMGDNAARKNIYNPKKTTLRQKELAKLMCRKSLCEDLIAEDLSVFKNDGEIIRRWTNAYHYGVSANTITEQIQKANVIANFHPEALDIKDKKTNDSIKNIAKCINLVTKNSKVSNNVLDFMGINNNLKPKDNEKFEKFEHFAADFLNGNDVSYLVSAMKRCDEAGLKLNKKNILLSSIKTNEKDLVKTIANNYKKGPKAIADALISRGYIK